MISEEELIKAFSNNPHDVLKSVIENKALKSTYRNILVDFIINSLNRDPRWEEFLWIALLPQRLSVVTVDNFCNLACRMCGGSKGKMNWLKPKMLQKMLSHCPTTELITFVAGNSEPMLNPDLKENFQILNEHNIRSTFVTNGHYLNRKNIEDMIEFQQPTSVNVSLDAIDSGIYKAIRGVDNTKVISGLFKLVEAKEKAAVKLPYISLLMVGMEDNISELPKFIKLADQIGAIRVHVDHMLGSYSPGDFSLNPKWRKYVVEAIELAEKLNVLLQLPLDTMQIIQREDLLNIKRLQSEKVKYRDVSEKVSKLKKRETIEFHDGTSCGLKSVSLEDNIEEITELKTGHCPWLREAHINIDGAIRPCCNMPANMGNIYEVPLWENQNFLQTRIHHSRGEIERLCMGNSNCTYVQELKENNIRPRYIRKEKILEKIKLKVV